MKTFRFVDPDAFAQHFHGVPTDAESIRQALFNAESLADSACAFFRGLYPIETPHFHWRKALYLPWSDRYHALDASGQCLQSFSISNEVRRVGRILCQAIEASRTAGDSPTFGMTYLIGSLAGERLKTQGLAVEVMIAVDEAVWHLTESRPIDAMNAISLAYQNIIECTVQAQLILGIKGEQPRIGADTDKQSNKRVQHRSGPLQ